MKMNWDQITSNWKKIRGKARERWSQLTDEDFDRVKGRKDQLVGLIQERYGKSREEAERDVENWMNSV